MLLPQAGELSQKTVAAAAGAANGLPFFLNNISSIDGLPPAQMRMQLRLVVLPHPQTSWAELHGRRGYGGGGGRRLRRIMATNNNFVPCIVPDRTSNR